MRQLQCRLVIGVEKALWAFSVPETSISQTEQIASNLYGFLGRVEEGLFHAHGRAYQLLHWLDTHRYCGRCGSQTELTEGGRATLCGACSHRVYPRVSPCVIVLVSKGDQLLLAAAAGFQKRFYSTLAGFMEPGETCEQAVAREVREEVGIEVGNIRYFSSQPWPFPSQVSCSVSLPSGHPGPSSSMRKKSKTQTGSKQTPYRLRHQWLLFLAN